MDEHIFGIAPTGAARATILFVPPLFEEANRMRRTLVLAMRALADHGFASLIADLPGQNESLVPTGDADLALWQGALAATAASVEGHLVVASIRGGALLDHRVRAAAWWRLAPVAGSSLLRTLLRARISADRERGEVSTVDGLLQTSQSSPLLLAGNRLAPAMIGQLGSAEIEPVTPARTVGLGQGGDKICGTPLWLRAEPGEDAAMAKAIAADIAAWSKTCGVT